MSAPLIVLDARHELDEAVAALERAGHRTLRTWNLPVEPWDLRGDRLFCCSEIASTEDARRALLAAVRGAGVVAVVDHSSAFGADFLDDLGRVGEVQHRAARTVPKLPPDQARLLALLAAGRSIPEAAALLFVSVRTAERRLAAARRALGARSTAEALRLVGSPGGHG